MHSQYTNLSNVACNILSFIPHGVAVEYRFSLGPDVIGKKKYKDTSKMHQEKVVVKKFAWANNGQLAANCAALEPTGTENYLELKIKAEERTLHTIAKVHDVLEMWQGSQNLHATQNETCAQNKH
jgi:hypothetical protein